MDISSYDSSFLTGRRAKHTLRRDIASYVEYNTIELDGVILKRVNTAVIDRKKTTYFKCRNMKTPYRVSGICHFSGRIADFPENLGIEIINDHNPTCSYLRKNSNSYMSSNLIKSEKSSAKRHPLVKKTHKKKKKQARRKISDESDIHDTIRENFKVKNILTRSLKIPKEIDQNSQFENNQIYIQLSTQADLDREKEAVLNNPNIFINIKV